MKTQEKWQIRWQEAWPFLAVAGATILFLSLRGVARSAFDLWLHVLRPSLLALLLAILGCATGLLRRRNYVGFLVLWVLFQSFLVRFNLTGMVTGLLLGVPLYWFAWGYLGRSRR